MRKAFSGSTGSDKMFITTPEAHAFGWRPEYATLTKESVIRVYPHFENGQMQAQLGDKGQGEDLIGDIVAPYYMVTNFGAGTELGGEKITGVGVSIPSVTLAPTSSSVSPFSAVRVMVFRKCRSLVLAATVVTQGSRWPVVSGVGPDLQPADARSPPRPPRRVYLPASSVR